MVSNNIKTIQKGVEQSGGASAGLLMLFLKMNTKISFFDIEYEVTKDLNMFLQE
jgi:hypothetical protein